MFKKLSQTHTHGFLHAIRADSLGFGTVFHSLTSNWNKQMFQIIYRFSLMSWNELNGTESSLNQTSLCLICRVLQFKARHTWTWSRDTSTVQSKTMTEMRIWWPLYWIIYFIFLIFLISGWTASWYIKEMYRILEPFWQRFEKMADVLYMLAVDSVEMWRFSVSSLSVRQTLSFKINVSDPSEWNFSQCVSLLPQSYCYLCHGGSHSWS